MLTQVVHLLSPRLLLLHFLKVVSEHVKVQVFQSQGEVVSIHVPASLYHGILDLVLILCGVPCKATTGMVGFMCQPDRAKGCPESW